MRAPDGARRERRPERRSPAAIPPHRPLAVEGVHAYTDRVSVAAGRHDPFSRRAARIPTSSRFAASGPTSTAPRATRSLHSFGPSPAAVQPIHPGSYLIVDKPLDADRVLAGPDARSLDSPLAHHRAAGDPQPVRRAASHCGFGLFVNEDGSLSFYLGDGGAFVDGEPAHDAPGQLRDGSQSARAEALPRQHAQLGAVEPVAPRRGAFRWRSQAGLGRWPRGRRAGQHSGPVAARRGRAADRRGRARGSRRRISSTPISPCRRSTARHSRRRNRGPVRRPGACPARPTPRSWPAGRSTKNAASAWRTRARTGGTRSIINRGTWMIGGPGFRRRRASVRHLRSGERPAPRPWPAAGFR